MSHQQICIKLHTAAYDGTVHAVIVSTFDTGVEMFGQARFSLTKQLTKALLVENAHNVEVAYQFRLRTRKRNGRENWSCMDCESMKKRT